MRRDRAIEIAQTYARRCDVPWAQIVRTRKKRLLMVLGVRSYEFLVDTSDGVARVVVDAKQYSVIEFEYRPHDPKSWLLPPWIVFPTFTQGTIFWRMAPGEHYWNDWHAWYAMLPEEGKVEYKNRFPEPERNAWEGFYELTKIRC